MFHVEYKGTTVKTGTYTQCVEYIQKSTHLCIDDLLAAKGKNQIPNISSCLLILRFLRVVASG